jgi:predicted  nucleic acid-binding Zn-ribbon protein
VGGGNGAAAHVAAIMTELGFVGLALALVAAAYCGSRQLPYETGMGDLRGRLEALREQMEAWQSAHDHQVVTLDRRMADVESAAARAEEEARIVSLQVAELSEGLHRRVEQIEERDEIERLASEGSG